MTRTAKKTKHLRGTHREQGDLISLLTKIKGDIQTVGQTQTDTQTDSKVIS
jgi:hypothetical protein